MSMGCSHTHQNFWVCIFSIKPLTHPLNTRFLTVTCLRARCFSLGSVPGWLNIVSDSPQTLWQLLRAEHTRIGGSGNFVRMWILWWAVQGDGFFLCGFATSLFAPHNSLQSQLKQLKCFKFSLKDAADSKIRTFIESSTLNMSILME